MCVYIYSTDMHIEMAFRLISLPPDADRRLARGCPEWKLSSAQAAGSCWAHKTLRT